MRMDRRFTSQNALADSLGFVRTSLEELSLDNRETNLAQLMTEESLLELLEHSKNEVIDVSIQRFLGLVKIKLVVPGKEFDFADDTSTEIRSVLLRSFGDRIRYRHFRNSNQISITAIKSPLSSLYLTLGALFFAVIVGLLLKNFASQILCDTLNEKILVPLRTVFMNGLKLCAVPVVFFSIASCIAQFGNLSEIKKIGANLLACFVVMQSISAFVGIGVFSLFPIEQGMKLTGASTFEAAKFSMIDTLVKIMPSNIISPFLEGDMLQLIVLAIFIGAATGMLKAKTIQNFLDESSKVFMKLTGTLMFFIPIVVFCSITSMFLTTGFSLLRSIFDLLIMVLVGFAAMMVIYALIAAFFLDLKPTRLFSKSLPMLLTSFSTSSSVAAFPDSIKTAEDLGISPKIYSLSIPLGASVNQNGTCVFVVITTLFLARAYGFEIPPSLMFSMALTAVVLTLGAASVPGFGIIALSMMMSQIGGPIEAIGLIISIVPVLDMFGTATNCMGDMTATLITATRLGLRKENEK